MEQNREVTVTKELIIIEDFSSFHVRQDRTTIVVMLLLVLRGPRDKMLILSSSEGLLGAFALGGFSRVDRISWKARANSVFWFIGIWSCIRMTRVRSCARVTTFGWFPCCTHTQFPFLKRILTWTLQVSWIFAFVDLLLCRPGLTSKWHYWLGWKRPIISQSWSKILWKW